jgi:small subunit ribosomal protein S1
VSIPVTVDENKQNQMQQDFAALLEESFNRSLKPGSVVVGEIVTIEKDHLVVDIGGKCEGLVPLKELSHRKTQEDWETVFQPGQIKEFFVVRDFEEDTPFLLSIRRVDMVKDWEELKRIHEADETIEVNVCGITRGGVLVQVRNLKGFIPASQLRIAKTLEKLVGETIPAKILEADKSKNKLILSHRAAMFESMAEHREKTLESLTEGMEMEGEVVKITHFGAFVDINGIDGLLPLSEISWRRLKHPSDVLVLGQQVKVKLLSVDRQLERISLSMKRMELDPWETVLSRFKEGDLVQGQVSKLLHSGFLAELEPGIEAFCSYHKADREKLSLQDIFSFKIVMIASYDRRITLELVNN